MWGICSAYFGRFRKLGTLLRSQLMKRRIILEFEFYACFNRIFLERPFYDLIYRSDTFI